MPPSRFRGRSTTTVYEYDEDGRVARTRELSPWRDEDRALLLAYQVYEESLCPGCGTSKDTAWHPDNDGWFEVDQVYVCHACTARDKHHNPEAGPVQFVATVDTRDYTAKPLPPFPAKPGGES